MKKEVKSMRIKEVEYNFKAIEKYWQSYWEEEKTFRAIDYDSRPKYYILDMFPYPSGAGLHIGHPEGYTASDILGRYKKARGYNVLHPMGWDAFGLPAEQHAINTGTAPALNTERNIKKFREQIKSLGFGLDWDREINTTDLGYYKWTQWIFLQLYKHGLAYVDEKPVWWCPALGTVLANEEIVDGKSERGNHPVERRNLRQWVLRITAYADRLEEGLKDLDWPDSTKRQQIAWIGRSEGMNIDFKLEGISGDKKFTVYTTRPDTIYGVTFLTISPEHPELFEIVKVEQKREVEAYVQQAKYKTDLERTELAKQKNGVFTGSYVIHPLTHEKIPVWVSDYVLMGYGTGVVMGVPGHDGRDYDFAKKYELPIIEVIKNPEADRVQLPLEKVEEGYELVNSGGVTGEEVGVGKLKIIDKIKSLSVGEVAVNYKLRDWLFSRQRYWGEPFPVIWVLEDNYKLLKQMDKSRFHEFLPKDKICYELEGQVWVALPMLVENLPLKLPEVKEYTPSGTGESPLAKAEDWLNIWVNLETGEVIEGRKAKQLPPKTSVGIWVAGVRETNTMPQWAGSCWYYLRYIDPKNEEAFADNKLLEYWGVPDFYIGGAEHAVLHLLYARFWHQFLFDIGMVKEREPFKKLFHQGIILGEDGVKMSKSLGNVVNPDEIIQEYGADSLRLYEMFLGPLEDVKPWSARGIEGVFRFLKKIWREYVDEGSGGISLKIQDREDELRETEVMLHQTIKKIEEDIESLRFNTAISQMMIFMNHLQKCDYFTVRTAKIFLQLLAPFAPHISEELWSRLGEESSIAEAEWPKYDAAKLEQTSFKLVIQVNGKVRSEVVIPKGMDKEFVLKVAKEDEKVKAYIEGKSIVKEVYVPEKILNIVIQ